MAKKPCDIDSCAVRDALQIVGGKWKSMILHSIGSSGKIRFNELKRALPEISQKMLTQQLRELERDGIIQREYFKEVPPRVEYSVSDLGKTIGDVYKGINLWQKKHLKAVKKNRKSYDGKNSEK